MLLLIACSNVGEHAALAGDGAVSRDRNADGARRRTAAHRAATSDRKSRANSVPLLIIDDLGMRKLPLTAAEELLEIIMRRYERASTLITSNKRKAERKAGQTGEKQDRRKWPQCNCSCLTFASQLFL
jgi:IstB-like ATP binding protein